MPETSALIISVLGCVLVAAGLTWYLIRGLRRGYLRDLLSPFITLVTPQRGLFPVLLMVAGGLVALAPVIINRIAGETVDDKPKLEVKTRTDVRFTLTGSKVEDFETLRTMNHLRVLQWANPAVTDAHLELLTGMKDLVELDLNDTKITDAGLAIIAKLPKLRSLRLARTNITDDGFRKHILPLKEIDELDLTLTPVKPATAREWQESKIGRRRPSL